MLADPIGILGGTFDPIHNGHLEIAVDVAKQLGIADMRLMPNPMPPHRDEPLLAPDDRIQALKLALEGYPSLSLEMSEWNAVAQGEANSGYTI
ncbi:MAG: adenylyltransferase/cytidyltransferase family protein, partial [Gammaproteobacteria bacterium]|nr:adenylyltransferase/cytidyltransferase family protein [Gammaproteobacteria bacterium]